MQKIRYADRRNQNRNARRVAQRTVGQPLGKRTQQRRNQNRDGEGHIPRQGEHRNAVEDDVHGDHEDFAVREVNQAQNAVNHRVADGDERIQAAQAQRVRERLQQSGCVKHARYPPLDFF